LAGPTPPAPTQWVTDTAGFLSKPVAQSLNAQLRDYQQRSGQQVLVWIGKSTDGDPIDDWAVRTFKAWRIGRKGFDDGLVLFVMAEDRTARIEVGYGLEGQVPDAVASRVINETLIPRIKAGDRDGAVEGAVEQVVTALGGKLAAAPSQQPVSPNSLQVIFAAVVIVVLVILGFRYPAFGYYLLMILSTMMRRGGGGGSDAGVGGGRSGGGGAGGKW
jgi:uncharacterized protein